MTETNEEYRQRVLELHGMADEQEAETEQPEESLPLETEPTEETTPEPEETEVTDEAEEPEAESETFGEPLDTGEEENEEVEEEEPLPFNDRLADLTKDLPVKPEQVDLSDPVNRYEAAKQELKKFEYQVQQNDFLNGLPQLEYGGKSIYEMSRDEFNDTLDDLQANSNHVEYSQFTEARNRAVKAAQDYQKQTQDLHKYKQGIEELRHSSEWHELETSWRKTLPEMTDDQVKLMVEYIEQKRLSSPTDYNQRVIDKRGKAGLINEAFTQLKLGEQISGNQTVETSTPSAPDSKAVRKKVKTNSKPLTFTREQIAKMTSEQYEKYEPQIEKAMREGLIR